MLSAFLIAGSILAQAAPAAAGAQMSAAPPAAAAQTVSPLVVSPQVSVSKRREVDPNEIICHDELPPGTRFAVRVCATRGWFRERTQLQQELVREWQAAPITSKGN